jgi:3-deoxy-D-manno-octulosonic-acid transferase
MAAGRPVIVAGSTVARKSDQSLSEEEIVIQAWERKPRQEIGAMLVLAPRHPERFAEVEKAASRFRLVTVNKMMQSGLADAKEATPSVAYTEEIFDEASRISGDTPSTGELAEIVLLDTIGDLAAVYGIADVAFVGGSLVARGGHNPLEPAQFGVPVVMGTSYENFRDVVGGMHAMDGIRIVEDRNVLSQAIMELLRDPAAAHLLGERGRAAFEAQAGATGRTVAMLTSLLTVKQ